MLKIGVRVFDLRVDGEKMVHSFTKCKKSRFGKALTVYDVTQDIFSFLEQNPSEAVVAFFKDDGKISGQECLAILKKIIAGSPEKWWLENEIPTLSQARGKIILLNRIDSSIGIDFSKMPYQGGGKSGEAQDFSPNGQATVTVQDRYTLPRRRKWEAAVLPLLGANESEKLILNHLSSAGLPFIPRFNARYINKRFLKHPLKENGYYGWLMLDFINSELAEKIIKTNFTEGKI